MTSSFVTPNASTAATDIFPVVSVPVLSKRTAFMRPASSRYLPLLKRIPRLAPAPIAAIAAEGVARRIPQGHETIMTVIVFSRLPVAMSIRAATKRVSGV